MNTRAETFTTYVQPHWRRLYLLAQQYVAREEVDDLVQESLLRAWRGYSPTDDRTYRPAWLLVIMRNVAKEWHRTAGRKVRLVLLPDPELTEIASSDLSEPLCPLPTMDEEQFREFLDERIATALDDLQPVFREVIILQVVGGLNYREIAEVLDCPVGTVMSRMARARRTLREKLVDFARPRCRSGRNDLDLH